MGLMTAISMSRFVSQPLSTFTAGPSAGRAFTTNTTDKIKNLKIVVQLYSTSPCWKGDFIRNTDDPERQLFVPWHGIILRKQHPYEKVSVTKATGRYDKEYRRFNSTVANPNPVMPYVELQLPAQEVNEVASLEKKYSSLEGQMKETIERLRKEAQEKEDKELAPILAKLDETSKELKAANGRVWESLKKIEDRLRQVLEFPFI